MTQNFLQKTRLQALTGAYGGQAEQDKFFNAQRYQFLEDYAYFFLSQTGAPGK